MKVLIYSRINLAIVYFQSTKVKLNGTNIMNVVLWNSLQDSNERVGVGI